MARVRVVRLKNGKFAAQRHGFLCWKWLDRSGTSTWAGHEYVQKYCICDTEAEARSAASIANTGVAQVIRP